MNRLLKIELALLLIIMGGVPVMNAQEYDTTLPKYFEISNAAEWTSELMTFEQSIDGFRLTVFKTNTASHTYGGYPFVTLAEIEITDAGGNKVSYTPTATNSLASNDGKGLAGLNDGDNSTFYHSAYSGNVGKSPDGYVYIELTFDEPQSAFMFRMVRRDNNLDFPLHFTFSALGEAAKLPYNPTNPEEPGTGNEEEPDVYYKVTVSADPASAAYVSGGGTILAGNTTYIGTSAKNTKYQFSHWTLNGVEYSTNRYVYSISPESDMDFVAHYNFVPSSPVEPTVPATVITSPLYVVTNNEQACSFNVTSGTSVEYDTWVSLEAYVSSGYEFQGWYKGTTLVSSSAAFSYLMPAEEVTLTAQVEKIVFNPESPDEPNSSQEDVQTTPTGDVNKDGVVNVLDIVAVVNYSLGEADENLPTYDVTGDGVVNVLDIVKIVNISLE